MSAAAAAQLWTWRRVPTRPSIAVRTPAQRRLASGQRLTHHRPFAASSSESESAPTRDASKKVASNAEADATDADAEGSTTTRIPRSEALRRMEAVLSRKPAVAEFLDALREVSELAGLPMGRCVWMGRLWGHASRRWSLPHMLAALKALDGAEVADLVRLTGQNGSVATAQGVYREAAAVGWCDGDGGAAMTAMVRLTYRLSECCVDWCNRCVRTIINIPNDDKTQ